MFIRKIKSRQSSCWQIGEKREGRFHLIKHIGCALKPEAIAALKLKAEDELAKIKQGCQLSLFPQSAGKKAILTSWRITGFHRFFGPIYEQIGFPINLLKDLTIARIVQPKSKLATVRYLNQHLGLNLGKDTIYRFLDTLEKNFLTKIAFDFVMRKNQGLNLIFYDVTTLYFETDEEDSFRQKGYSKDRRSDLPQVVIGLFVDNDGYPFDFDSFAGKVFEGQTFPIIVKKLKERYQVTNFTVVADAGMLSEANLNFLTAEGINYIVGARLKSLAQKTLETIFAHDFSQESIFEVKLTDKSTNKEKRLLVDFSAKRAKKDQANRERLIEKLQQKLAEKKLSVRKSKYLVWKNRGQITGIDQSRITEDQKCDGLKGYWTNLENLLSSQEIIDQYRRLWQIERAFRMSKTDLLERPIFHWREKRIKSHLLLCFCSLLVMKEAERLLARKDLSLAQAVEILETVGEGEVKLDQITLPIESEISQTAQEILTLIE